MTKICEIFCTAMDLPTVVGMFTSTEYVIESAKCYYLDFHLVIWRRP